MSQNPGTEPPIFVETLHDQRHHSYTATTGDAVHRFPVRLSEIWNQFEQIPDVPDPSLLLDGDIAGVTQLYKSRAISLIPGTTHKFQLTAVPGDLTRVVTATQGAISPIAGNLALTLAPTPQPATGFTPVIQDATGAVFEMEASVWIVDGSNNFVEFPYGVPGTMVAPFTLTFVQYIGTFGGNSGAAGDAALAYVADVTGTSLVADTAFASAVVADWVTGSDGAAAIAQSTEGDGSRTMFDVSKGAFRAGTVTGAEWDDANRGVASAAFGTDNTVGSANSAILGGSGLTLSDQDDTLLTQRLRQAGGHQIPVEVVTADLTATIDHYAFSVDSSGGAVELTLPAAPVAGQIYWIKFLVGGNPLTVGGNGNVVDQNDGTTAATLSLTTPGEVAGLVWDSTSAVWTNLENAGVSGPSSAAWDYVVDATGTSFVADSSFSGAVVSDWVTGVDGAAAIAQSTEGDGSRTMFDVSKGAFRAGTVTGAEWDDVSRGVGSAAFGTDNTVGSANSAILGGSSLTLSDQDDTLLTQRLRQAGGHQIPVEVVTADLTATIDHYALSVDTTGGAVVLTMPAAPVAGQLYWIKFLVGGNTLTVNGGGNVIDQNDGTTAATLALASPGEVAGLVWDAASSIWTNLETLGSGSAGGAAWDYVADVTGTSLVADATFSGAVVSDWVTGVDGAAAIAQSTEGDGSRTMFDVSKGAFRAGTVTGVEWDDASRGVGSAAFGTDNTVGSANSAILGGSSLTLSDQDDTLLTQRLRQAGGHQIPVEVVAADLTATTDHYAFSVDTSGGAVVLTMPAAPVAGQLYWIKFLVGGNTLTVDGNGNVVDKNDGTTAASLVMTTPGEVAGLVWDAVGSIWTNLETVPTAAPTAAAWDYVVDTSGTSLVADATFSGAVVSDWVTGVDGAAAIAQSTEGDGSRTMFDVSKGAFRAGTVTGVEWDDASRGVGSAAFGTDNTVGSANSAILGGSSLTLSDQDDTLLTQRLRQAGGHQIPVEVVTADLTATIDHYAFSVDTSGGAIVLTMPAAPVAGQLYWIKLLVGGNTLTVSGGGNVIDQNDGTTAATLVMTAPGEVAGLAWDAASSVWTNLEAAGTPPAAAWDYVVDATGTSLVADATFPGAVVSDWVTGVDGAAAIAQSTEGGGSRTMFDVSKGAFRAGTVTGVEWDDANRGVGSAAFGTDNTVGSANSAVVGGSSLTLSDQDDTLLTQRLRQAGGHQIPVEVVTADLTATVDHYAFSVDTSGGAVVLTMPAAPVSGQLYWIKLLVGGNALTVNGGGNVIDQNDGTTAATLTLTAPGEVAGLVWDAASSVWTNLEPEGASTASAWDYVADVTGTSLVADASLPGAVVSDWVTGVDGAAAIAQSTEGDGSRTMFDVSKGAFRAGTVTGGEWDDANRGVGSAAFGTDNTVGSANSAIVGGSSLTISDQDDTLLTQRLRQAGGHQIPVEVVTADLTATIDHYAFSVDTSGGAVVLTMPAAPVAGQVYWIKFLVGGNVFTVNGNGNVIDQNDGTTAATLALAVPGDVAGLVWDAASSVWTNLEQVGAASPITPAPATLDLFVSTGGDDVAGDGSSGNPYLTLDRALRDVQETGWNDTASVTILASGGNYVLPTGELSLNAGTKGAQKTPLRITGSGRTSIGTDTVVSSTLVPSYNMLAVNTTGAYALSSADNGVMARFSTGPLATYSLGGAFTSTTEVDVPMHNIGIPTRFDIPFSGGTAGAGDVVNYETFDTTVEMTGGVKIRSDASAVVFEEFNLIVHGVNNEAALIADNTSLGTYGLNVVIDANVTFAAMNPGGVWYSGNTDDNLNGGLVASTRSMYIDARAGGATFHSSTDEVDRTNQDKNWSNMIFIGSTVDTTPFLMSGTLTSVWVVGIRTPFGPSLGDGLVIDSVFIDGVSNRFAFQANGGDLRISNVSILEGSAFNAVNNGRIFSSNINATGAGGNTTEFMQAVNNSTITLVDDITFNTGRLLVDKSSTIDARGDVILTNGASNPVQVLDGSTLKVAGLFDVDGTGTAVRVAGGSVLTAQGNLVCDPNSMTQGVVVEDRSEVTVGGSLQAVGCSQNGVVVDGGSKLVALQAVVANSAGASGMTITDNSTVIAKNMLQLQGAAQASLLIESSTLEATTAQTHLMSNSADGVLANGSTIEFTGGLDCSGATNSGISLNHGSRLSMTTEVGIVPILVAGSGTGLSIASSSTLTLTEPNAADGAINASGCGVTGIALDGNSTLHIDAGTSATVAANNASSGNGVSVSDGSRMLLGDCPITADTAGGNGIQVDSGSKFLTTNSVASSSNAANGVLVLNSVWESGAVVTASNIESGINVVDCGWSSGAITSSGNIISGVVLSNCTWSSDTVTAGGNSGFGVLSADSRWTSGLVTVTGNASGGATFTTTTATFAAGTGVHTINNNGGNNLVLDGTTMHVTAGLNCDGAVGTNLGLSNQSRLDVSGVPAGAVPSISAAAGSEGVNLTSGSTLTSPSITATGNVNDNVSVVLSAIKADDLVVDGSTTGHGLYLENATADLAGTVTAAGNALANISMNAATLRVLGTITTTGSASDGLTADGGSKIRAGVATATGNSRNVLLIGSEMVVDGTFTSSGATAIGGLIAVRSQIRVATADVSNNAGLGIYCKNTVVDVEGSAAVNTNTGTNIELHVSTMAAAALTATGSTGGSSLHLDGSHLHVSPGSADVSSSALTNIVMSLSTLSVSGELDATGSVAGTGITATESDLKVSAAADFSTNDDDNCQFTGSSATFGGALTAAGSVTGSGLVLVRSNIDVAAAVSASANAVDNITISNSTLVISGDLTINNSVAGNGLMATDSTITCENYNARTNALNGTHLIDSGFTTAQFQSRNNVVGGAKLTRSTLNCESGPASSNPVIDNGSYNFWAESSTIRAFGGFNLDGSTITATFALKLDTGSSMDVAASTTNAILATSVGGRSLDISGGSSLNITGTTSFSILAASCGLGALIAGGSSVTADGPVELSTNASGDGLELNESRITATNLEISLPAAGGASLAKSQLHIAGDCVVTTPGSYGVLLDDSTLDVDATLTVTNSGGIAVDVLRSSIVVVRGDMTVTGSGIYGVRLVDNSDLTVTGNLDGSASADVGIVCIRNSQIVVNGNVTLTGMLDRAISHGGGSRMRISGGLTVTVPAGSVGVDLGNNGTLHIIGGMNITGDGQCLKIVGNCVATCSSIFASSGLDDAVVLNNGAVLKCTSLNAVGRLLVASGSTLNSSGAITVSNSSGAGVQVANNSMVTASLFDGFGNAGVGLLLETRSQASTTTNNPALNTITGAGGDVTVGTNPVATWVTIITATPAVSTDYTPGPGTTELCSIMVKL